MVYDIMRKLGENDPIVLAAAILHDSIEDCSQFKAGPTKMCDELLVNLYKEGLYDADNTPPHDGRAHQLTRQIHDVCMQVTNPKILDGDGVKENYQHDRIVHMSFAAKKIKIADQAASMICNLTMPNNPEKFSLAQEIAFTEKAHTLGVGIVESVQGNAEQRRALEPYASFFGKTLLNVYPLIQTGDALQKKQIRDGFDFNRLFEAGHDVNILPAQLAVNKSLALVSSERKTGITRVDFDDSGKVCSYGVWTAWDDPKGEANLMQAKLTEQLRAMRRMGGTHYGASDPLRTLIMPRGLDNVKDGAGKRLHGVERAFAISPPLEAMAFAAAAKNAGAVNIYDQEIIRQSADRIKYAEDFPTPASRHKTHPRIGPTVSGKRWHD